MIHIGKKNRLMVLRQNAQGYVLDGGSAGEIMLPKHQTQGPVKQGTVIEAFVYPEADGHLAAMTRTPLAQLGDVAWLKVISINRLGVFLNWGWPRDLLLPGHEQAHDLRVGDQCLVKVFLDEQGRITASEHLSDFITEQGGEYKEGQKVELLIADRTPLGVRVIVNNDCWGLLYHDDIFKPLEPGQRCPGFVKKVREDGRLDITLNASGYARVSGDAERVLKLLQQHKGFMAFTDKSPPDAIYNTFGMSKKVFKQAIGTLYKQRLIVIGDDGLRLVKK